MLKFFKKPIVVAAFVLIAGAAGFAYLRLNGSSSPSYDFVIAERKDIVQKVNVSGKVKPSKAVDLAFEIPGKVFFVSVFTGKRVSAGEALVALDDASVAAQFAQASAAAESAKAQLTQYEAALLKENAKLLELRRGARPEEIQVQEVKVENANTALKDTEKNLSDKLLDSYTKSDDAVRSKADQIFNNPRSGTPQVNIFVSSQTKSDLESRRIIIEKILTDWSASLFTSLETADGLLFRAAKAKQDIFEITVFLDNAALAVNSLLPSAAIPQTVIDGYKTDISSARVSVNAAAGNIIAAEEKLRTAKSSLALAERELALKKSGTTEEQISAQEAQVKSAEANILTQKAKIKEAEANAQYYGAQSAKTILRSPINGVVTAKKTEVGEIISANQSVVSIISEANFEIESNIPEADTAKVKIGARASATLDAYERDIVFEAAVSAIDPAETVIDGVTTYKTALQFLKQDERIKSGMTANIDIFGEKRERVVSLPQRAVIRREGKNFARVLEDGIENERQVETGLRGSDGNIEILNGVKEGDKIIIF